MMTNEEEFDNPASDEDEVVAQEELAKTAPASVPEHLDNEEEPFVLKLPSSDPAPEPKAKSLVPQKLTDVEVPGPVAEYVEPE